MMYRVLALALLSCAPAAASAAALLHARLEHVHAGVPVSFTAPLPASSPADETGTLLGEDVNAMWDPLGAGCIDPTDPEGWTATGQRDPEAGTLCIAQPCARLLTEDEIAYPVLGRALRDGEWDLYLTRQASACVAEPGWSDASGLDLLPQDAQGWEEPALSPDVALSGAAPGPRHGRAPAPRFGPFAGSFGGGSSSGSSPGGETSGGGTSFKGAGTDWSGAPGGSGGQSTFQPDGDGSGTTPGSGELAGGGNDGAGPGPGQPQPVPLPGSFALLLAGLAAPRLPRH